MMGKSTSPRDLGVHVEEAEDRPFLELVQYYRTVKRKKTITHIDTLEAHMDVNTVNINYQMLPGYCMYISENYDVVSININCYSLRVLD